MKLLNKKRSVFSCFLFFSIIFIASLRGLRQLVALRPLCAAGARVQLVCLLPRKKHIWRHTQDCAYLTLGEENLCNNIDD